MEIEDLEIGAVEERLFAGSPARHFTIRWPGKERRIIFLEKDAVVYRIIYDPTSPINRQILDTVRFQ